MIKVTYFVINAVCMQHLLDLNVPVPDRSVDIVYFLETYDLMMLQVWYYNTIYYTYFGKLPNDWKPEISFTLTHFLPHEAAACPTSIREVLGKVRADTATHLPLHHS